MKIKRKISLFVALLSLLYCTTLIQSTYAKYVSSAAANSELQIARWNILINEQDVLDNSNFTNSLTPVFAGNETIKEDVIAPTSEGYFDLIIDGTNVDVGFNYTITINPLDEYTVKDLVISKYALNDVEYTYEDSITGNLELTDVNRNIRVRVYLKWDDSVDTQQMTNTDDTEATVTGNATYTVNVNIIQSRSVVNNNGDN